MRANPIRVALVCADRVLLEALSYRIDAEPDLQVVGAVENGEEGLDVIATAKPHVLVIDVDLPGCGPFAVAKEISRRQTNSRVILLAGHVTEVFLQQCAHLRLSGFVTRDEPLDALIKGIEQVAGGGEFFSSAAARRLRFDPSNHGYSVPSNNGLSALTPRQFEIFSQLAKGRSVKEVARVMHLSLKAVASHKYRLMKKLDVHDRVELARLAIREGVLLP